MYIEFSPRTFFSLSPAHIYNADAEISFSSSHPYHSLCFLGQALEKGTGIGSVVQTTSANGTSAAGGNNTSSANSVTSGASTATSTSTGAGDETAAAQS
jgi:hypothetical protein